jgi:hypothetical protein
MMFFSYRQAQRFMPLAMRMDFAGLVLLTVKLNCPAEQAQICSAHTGRLSGLDLLL